MKRKSFLAGLLAAACLGAPAFAQSFPNRPVTLISGFPAGR